MKNIPFFSVVIPTYNSEEFLERCLNSVFNQEYKNFEIIIVDNSSTDTTENILNKYSSDKLKILSVNNNGIIGYSRNIGINNAKGEWIAFLDSDDIWNTKKLHKVKEEISKNNEAILISHDEFHVQNGEIISRLRYGPGGSDMHERLLFKGNTLSTSAVCLKKIIALKSKGFSESVDFITVEDYEYWLRLSKMGKFYFIDEVLGEWHTHSHNYSSNTLIHANAFIKVKEYHFKNWLKEFPNMNYQVKIGRSKMYFNASRIMQKGKYFFKAIKFSIKSIILNPFEWKAWVTILLSVFRIKN